jgi:hypothetical protein
MKPILTKEENVNLYLKNFMQLGEALMNAGGNSFMVLKQYDEFLRTLAANNIEVTAKYNPPDETMPLKTTGENEMIFFDEVDQKMTEEGYNEFGEYILSPKNLELQKKWRENKAKFDEDFAKIGIRRDPMWQKPLSTSNPNTSSYMNETPPQTEIPVDNIQEEYVDNVQKEYNDILKYSSYYRPSDGRIFTRIAGTYNYKSNHKDRNAILEYTVDTIKRCVNDKTMVGWEKIAEQENWNSFGESHNKPELKEENPKPTTLEVYPDEVIHGKNRPKYFLEIYNGKQWKLWLTKELNFSVPKFGWSSVEAHPYNLGQGKIAPEGLISMYSLHSLKKIVDGLNMQDTKESSPLPPPSFETSKEKIDWQKNYPYPITTSP